MTEYIQFHLLTFVPPIEMSPLFDTFELGGHERLRISAEGLKQIFSGAVAAPGLLRAEAFSVNDHRAFEDEDEDDGNLVLGVAPVLYVYVCIDRGQLLASVDGDEQTVNEAVADLLVRASALPVRSPGFIAHASYILIERGASPPRSLGAAFITPIFAEDPIRLATVALDSTRIAMNVIDGVNDLRTYRLHVGAREGTISGAKSFLQAG